MSTKKPDLETLELKSVKRKNFLFIAFIGGIFLFLLMSFVNFLLSVDNTKVYEARKIDKMDELSIIKKKEIKETWAIAIENRLKKQEDRTREVIETLQSSQNQTMSELKNIIMDNNKQISAQIDLMRDSSNARLSDMEKMIEQKLEEQNSRIDQLEKIKTSRFNDMGADTNNYSDNLVIGIDNLPKVKEVNVTVVENNLTKEIKEATALLDLNSSDTNETIIHVTQNTPKLSEENRVDITAPKNIDREDIASNVVEPIVEKPKRKKLVSISVDTGFNSQIIKAQQEQNAIASDEGDPWKPYHISTGFGKAFMLTGAMAPTFQEGSMERLPVLFETEGNIIMANDTVGDIEKCFLLGSARGNMSTETADIKLVSISCLINGGKARIEGSITGWIINEDGSPGLKGDMIHKNGQWLAKTFLSGLFSTFAQALTGPPTQPLTFDTGTTTTTTSTTDTVNNGFMQAGASGIANVFTKLGDYYIKMAEQIFPIIEVKGGRTVSILLIGGEDLNVVENNKVNTAHMNEVSEKIELKKLNKHGRIPKVNAFTKVITENQSSGGLDVTVKAPGKTANNQDIETPQSGVDDSFFQDMADTIPDSLEDIPEITGGF